MVSNLLFSRLLFRGAMGSLIALSSLDAAAATADTSTPLLVGSYTAGSSVGIYVYDFNSRTGQIDKQPVQAVKTENPSWLTFSTDRHFLYAVNENGPGQRDIVGRVSAYDVDQHSGKLTLINQVKTLGSEPTHSSISRDGHYLFIANYSVLPDPGGTLAVVPINSQGGVEPVTQIKTDRASQVNPERQMSPHVHSSASSPDGRYVFAEDLGADRVYAYRYDPAANAEAPLTAVEGQPYIQFPPGSGPRHLIFSKDGKHAYLTLEMAGKVAVLDYADGHLTIRQLLPLAAAGFKGKLGAGALHLSPDSRFLYVTDRGEDNQLVTFAVTPGSGELRLLDRRSVEGKEPREFAFDPSGRYVLIANQHSNAIVVMRRDPASGKVGKTVQTLSFDAPSDLKFLATP
jgi:6-phosphogluconolactonase (cycloisomerase 2 family)